MFYINVVRTNSVGVFFGVSYVHGKKYQKRSYEKRFENSDGNFPFKFFPANFFQISVTMDFSKFFAKLPFHVCLDSANKTPRKFKWLVWFLSVGLLSAT